MSEEFSTALMLMGVGMITVFVVLSLVVLVGKGLITFINKYVPEVISLETKRVTNNIEPGKIAAITAAVEAFTSGKGQITRIDKIH